MGWEYCRELCVTMDRILGYPHMNGFIAWKHVNAETLYNARVLVLGDCAHFRSSNNSMKYQRS